MLSRLGVPAIPCRKPTDPIVLTGSNVYEGCHGNNLRNQECTATERVLGKRGTEGLAQNVTVSVHGLLHTGEE